MNWNAVRHVPGSSSDPDAETIKVIMDRRGGFSSMVYVIHAGNDHMFWQVCVPGHARQLRAVCVLLHGLAATSCMDSRVFPISQGL